MFEHVQLKLIIEPRTLELWGNRTYLSHAFLNHTYDIAAAILPKRPISIVLILMYTEVSWCT